MPSSLPFHPSTSGVALARAALAKPWAPVAELRAHKEALERRVEELLGQRRRLWGAVAGACALALMANVHGFECQPPARTAELPASPPALVTWADAGVSVADAPKPGEAPAHVKGQKAAPCDPDVETEVGGYCWLSLEQRPCKPGKTVSWNGKCLAPVSAPAKIPTTLEP